MTTRRTFIASLVAIACGLFTRERPGMRWLKANGKRPVKVDCVGTYWLWYSDRVHQGYQWRLPRLVFDGSEFQLHMPFTSERAAMEAAAIAVEKAGLC